MHRHRHLQQKEEKPTMSADPNEVGRVTVTFDRSTVELDALQRAAYAVADLMTIDITVSGDQFVCTLFARNPRDQESELAHRLRAEVIDQTLRLRIAAKTEPLRNLVFALAFSRTGLADAGDTPE
jgi:His-Xaa-Ser system protein HxsD